MRAPVELRFRSALAASTERVWAHASTMSGVNEELAPLVRMGLPRAAAGRTLADAPLGQVAFRSVLYAGGVVPFDVHTLVLVTRAPGHFVERSRTWLHRAWEHERRVTPAGHGCVVEDRVRVEPRLALASVAVRPLVALVFRHRHRVLVRKFGAAPASPSA